MITFLFLALIVGIVTIVECGAFLGIGILLFGDIFVFILIMHKIFKNKKSN